MDMEVVWKLRIYRKCQDRTGGLKTFRHRKSNSWSENKPSLDGALYLAHVCWIFIESVCRYLWLSAVTALTRYGIDQQWLSITAGSIQRSHRCLHRHLYAFNGALKAHNFNQASMRNSWFRLMASEIISSWLSTIFPKILILYYNFLIMFGCSGLYCTYFV
jgi:hypothetical protein